MMNRDWQALIVAPSLIVVSQNLSKNQLSGKRVDGVIVEHLVIALREMLHYKCTLWGRG
jgi:hypothetical protein